MFIHRPLIMGSHGMVASAHPQASLAGLDVLRSGGNAIDATIATNAVLNVVQPGMCGIGGDLFALVYSAAHRRLYFLNASGRSAAGATPAELQKRGLTSVPVRGILSVTVPGCVDGWFQLLNRFGSKPATELLSAAIRLADEGHPLSYHMHQAIKATAQLNPHPSWLATFCPNNSIPNMGEMFYQHHLARSLQLIAENGPDAYYKGPIARSIVETSRSLGGWLTEADLAAHTSTWGDPINTQYRGYTIYEAPPNTQGIAALEALNICSGWDLGRLTWDDPLRVHRMVEAKKLAFADRDAYIGDPEFCEVPLARLLSESYARELWQHVSDTSVLTPQALQPGEGDTTYFAVADGQGNLVSCIQSNYRGFGALVVPEGTGISLHNRGSYFNAQPGHPNCLAPRKRPFHTLIPGMVFAGEKPVTVFGTMGGDGQPQTHLQLLSNIIDHGMNVQEAIEAPRWYHGPLLPDDPPHLLRMEARFGSSLAEALRKLGHQVELVEEWSSHMGHAQAIALQNGIYLGGADPRGDGYALGW